MNNTYEKTSIKDRVKELLTLFAFIIGSLISSIIVMDLIIFPISLFSINNKEIFNLLVKNITWILFLSLIVFLIVRKVIRLKKDGLGYGEITQSILVKPLKAILVGIIFTLFVSILIMLIYALISYNYYLIYKFINI